jgi:hypothetical protein
MNEQLKYERTVEELRYVSTNVRYECKYNEKERMYRSTSHYPFSLSFFFIFRVKKCNTNFGL